MIYLDSCLVIYLVEPDSLLHVPARRAAAAAVEHGFAISPLVVMECLVGPLRAGDERMLTSYRRTFDTLTSIPLGSAVLERAARLRAVHRLKTPDAIHLAAAQESGCEELWTNDDRLRRAAGGFARVVGR